MRASPAVEGENKRTVSGYALLFDVPTVLFTIDGVDYTEVIDRSALNGCDFSDVVFDRGHAMEDKLLARTSNGSLRLRVDEKGLAFEADIADTQEGRDCFELIKRGDINGCSFAAVVEEDSYNEKTHTRRIIRFSEMFDVAAVTFPAYPTTEISAVMRRAFGLDGPDGKNVIENGKNVIETDDFVIKKQKMLMRL